MVWLTVLGIAKRIGAWLTSLSFWQLVSLGLAVLVMVQQGRVWSEQRHSQKVAMQLNKCNGARMDLQAKLDAISTKRNEQKAETQTRIVTVEKQIRHADDQAKIIERAPLPGNCKSPSEILQADI
jgi:endonuclease/exonuclease/phosphatase (EEP) superfamily protein YafD